MSNQAHSSLHNTIVRLNLKCRTIRLPVSQHVELIKLILVQLKANSIIIVIIMFLKFLIQLLAAVIVAMMAKHAKDYSVDYCTLNALVMGVKFYPGENL